MRASRRWAMTLGALLSTAALPSTARAQARELDEVDALAVWILERAGELQNVEFAVVPRDEPLTDGVRPACSPMWQLAFSLQRHMQQHITWSRSIEGWQTWVATSEGLEHLGDSSSGTFLTAVRERYGAGYTVLISLGGTPAGSTLEVETVYEGGSTLRRIEVPLRRALTPQMLPASEDRCLEDSSLADNIESMVTQFVSREPMRSRVDAGTVVWLQPDAIRPPDPTCDRARVLHERVSRQLPGARRDPAVDEVRRVAPDASGAGTAVLSAMPSANTVLVLRRAGESPSGVLMSAELWGRDGLVGRTLNYRISPANWMAMTQRLRCTQAPTRSFAVRPDPQRVLEGIDYHEHPRSWVLYLQGHVGGALRTVDGDDGRTAFGGSLRLDVATATDDALVHLGVGAGLSTDSVGWAQALVSLRAGSFFRAGLGAGATASLSGDFALTDGMVSANVVILAPLFPGFRRAGATLSVEAFKGFTTPLAYLTISLGLWFGRS